MEHFDLIVIGSGPAGEKGAAQAAYFGKRVALVERAEHLGGACVNTGTIPSKTLRETALYFSGLRQRGLYGIDYSLNDRLTVEDFMYRKQIVVANEWHIIRNNLERHNVQLIYGNARLRDAHTVAIERVGRTIDYRADVILLATGSSPVHPPEIPFDHERIYDSDSILHMKFIPKTMVVVGGGVIGTEYASIFTALGTEVTLVEPRGGVVSFIDSEISGRLVSRLQDLGLRFVFNERVKSIQRTGDKVRMYLENTGELECECALIAAGRQSNVEGLGVEEVGIKLGKRGVVSVNEKYQTSVPNIYAAGDVIGFPALASTSMEQARVAMVHAFNLQYKENVSPTLPLAVYAIPEISSVGLSEDECKEKNIEYLVGRSSFGNSPRGQIIGETTGMIKLVFAPSDKRLLGAHIIGEQASELIHLAAHVIDRSETIDAFIHAVYNYPTLSDSYKYAAYDGLGNRHKWLAGRER
jgi:NAD(P) transhydrogenase